MSWQQVRSRLDEQAPPVPLDSIRAKATSGRPRRRRVYSAAAVLTLAVAACAVALSRGNSDNQRIATTATTQVAADAPFELPAGEMPMAIAVGPSDIAIASTTGERGRLTFFSPSGEQMADRTIPGEIGQSGMVWVGDRLVFSVGDELGPGTGLYVLDPEVGLTKLATLPTIATIAQVSVDVVAVHLQGGIRWYGINDVDDLRTEVLTEGFGWLATDSEGRVVASERDASALRTYSPDGQVVREVRLEAEDWLGHLALANGRTAVGSGSQVLIVGDDDVAADTIAFDGPVAELVATGDSIFALTTDHLVRIRQDGSTTAAPLGFDAEPSTMALTSQDEALVCSITGTCSLVPLPQA